MVPLDLDTIASVRTRFTASSIALQDRITALISRNEQLSHKLLSQIKANKQVIVRCQLALHGEVSSLNNDAIELTLCN